MCRPLARQADPLLLTNSGNRSKPSICDKLRMDSVRSNLRTAVALPKIGCNQCVMNYLFPVHKAFLRVFGPLWAQTIGRLDRYSAEHRQFLSSGCVCKKCHQTLMGKGWTAGVNCYDEEGKKISIMKARLKGRYFECPKCLHRWPISQSR